MSAKPPKRKEDLAPRPASGSRWWWYAAGLAAALAALFEVYSPSLQAPFLFDDLYLPFLHPDFANAPLGSWLSGQRPLLMLGYWMNYQTSQTDPLSYHVVNVLFHFVNGVLAWLVVRRLLEWAGVAGGKREGLAVFGGALFLFHPLQTEAVTYVASRSETQSVAFFLAAFALFLYRRSAAVSTGVTIGILGLSAAAVLSKEHTAVLVGLLLLTDFYWNPGFTFEGIRKNWKLYAPIALGTVLAALFVLRALRTATTAGFGVKDFTWYQYFFTQCRAIWVYLRMFLLPYGLTVDHDFAISKGILDGGAIFGMLGLIAGAAAAWIWRHEYKLASYGYFAFILLLAPTSSVIPIADVLVERRVYLAFFPLILICCEVLRRVRWSRAVLTSGLAVVVAAFGALTYARNQIWANPVAFWQDTVEKSPGKSRPHFQLAYAYYQAGMCAEASREYAKVEQTGKPDDALYIDWALATDCAGQTAEAISRLNKALALSKSAHAYSLVGMMHAKLKQPAEALAALDLAQKADPTFATTYVYRGNIYLLSGEFDKAEAAFRRALELAPADANARNGLDLALRRVIPQVQ